MRETKWRGDRREKKGKGGVPLTVMMTVIVIIMMFYMQRINNIILVVIALYVEEGDMVGYAV